MPIFITDAKTPQLEYIATQCASLDEIKKMVGEDQADFFITNTFYRNFFKFKQISSIWLGLNEAIDLSSTAVDVFWITIAFVALGAAAIWLAGLAALVTVGLMSCGLYGYYKNNQKYVNKTKEEIQLTIIKIQALDELLKRNKPMNWLETEKNNKPLVQAHFPKKEAISVGVGASVLLVTTFYWGIMDTSVMLGFFSATSLLAGPVGFGIAAAIGIVMGVMIAVKYYQAKKASQLLEHSKTELHSDLHDKTVQLDVFKQFKQHQSRLHSLEEQKQTSSVTAVHDRLLSPLKRSASLGFFASKEVKETKSLSSLDIGVRYSC